MILNGPVSIWKKYRILFFIAVPIILFNWIGIFGPHALFKDDPARYYQASTGTFPYEYWSYGLFLWTINQWIAWKIMTVSPVLIRGIYVVLFMIPLSVVMYCFFRKKLGFAASAAYFAAVLPQVLTRQDLIPAYINGNYVVPGLLIVMGAIYAVFAYLEALPSRTSYKALITATSVYFAASQHLDFSIFFFPIFVFIIYAYRPLTRKHFLLMGSLSLVFLYKIAWMIAVPRDAASGILLSLTKIHKRIDYYFLTMLPVPKWLNSIKDPVLVFVFLLIITGFILELRRSYHIYNQKLLEVQPVTNGFYKAFLEKVPGGRKQYPGVDSILFVYGFLVLWLVCTIAAFIFLSPHLNERYAYIPAFALIALLGISLQSIFNTLLPHKNRVLPLVFIGLIIFSGITRFTNLKKYYSRLNHRNEALIQLLGHYSFPPGSQIVLYLSKWKNYWAVWDHSGGNLRFLLNRDDIDGLIGYNKTKYYHFYNAFDMKDRRFGNKSYMRGLSSDRPLFLFVERKNKLRQYRYALQWKEKENMKNSPWIIFKISKKTGKAVPFLTGKGYEQYMLAVKSLAEKGIKQSRIMWGGIAKK